MAIIDSYNKKRGVTYVYDSFSYWDKELKQPRSRRRLLGRRDPDTGELVPTRKPRSMVTPAKADCGTDYATLYRQSQEILRDKDALILPGFPENITMPPRRGWRPPSPVSSPWMACRRGP